METERLREIIDLAQTRSFTRTSSRLNIHQTTLTRHVDALERELGFRLFDRSTVSVALTAEGDAFLEYAYRVLDDVRKGVEAARGASRRARRALAVGGGLMDLAFGDLLSDVERSAGAGAFVIKRHARHLTDFIADVAEEHPLDLLARGEIDVAFLEAPLDCGRLDGFRHEVLFLEEAALFASGSSPVALNGGRSLGDLRGMRLIVSLAYPDYWDAVAESLAAQGVPVETRFRSSETFSDFYRDLADDEFCAVPRPNLPRFQRSVFEPNVRIAPTDGLVMVPAHLVWREGDEREGLVESFVRALLAARDARSVSDDSRGWVVPDR